MQQELIITPIAEGVADATELPDAYGDTFEVAIPVAKFRELVVYLDVAHDGLTSVEVLLESSRDGTNYGACQNDNAGTAADVQISKALSGDAVLPFRFDVTGLHYARIRAKRTGGSSADTAGMSWSGNAG